MSSCFPSRARSNRISTAIGNCATRGTKGFSIIEMMVGLAISTIVIMGVFRFYTSINRSQKQNDWRLAAKSINQSLDSILTRDFKFGTDFSIASDNQTMTLKRRRLYIVSSPMGPDITVTYATRCASNVTTNPALRQLIQKVYDGHNAARFSATPDKCLKKMACSADQIVQIKITPSVLVGSDIPKYPVTLFPDIAKPSAVSLNHLSAGSAVCFTDVTPMSGRKKVRVVVESINVKDEKSGDIEVQIREFLLSEAVNSDSITILK